MSTPPPPQFSNGPAALPETVFNTNYHGAPAAPERPAVTAPLPNAESAFPPHPVNQTGAANGFHGHSYSSRYSTTFSRRRLASPRTPPLWGDGGAMISHCSSVTNGHCAGRAVQALRLHRRLPSVGGLRRVRLFHVGPCRARLREPRVQRWPFRHATAPSRLGQQRHSLRLSDAATQHAHAGQRYPSITPGFSGLAPAEGPLAVAVLCCVAPQHLPPNEMAPVSGSPPANIPARESAQLSALSASPIPRRAGFVSFLKSPASQT